MIFARDKSQMCNNLLQYAHVYAWGREHGRKVISMRFSDLSHAFNRLRLVFVGKIYVCPEITSDSQFQAFGIRHEGIGTENASPSPYCGEWLVCPLV